MNDEDPEIIFIESFADDSTIELTFRNADIASTAFHRIMRELGYMSEDWK